MTYNRHYCYRIDFADGFVYFGVKSCDCDPAEDTSYMGSPVTHAAKWLTDIPRVKSIVSVHATRQLAMEAEDKLIEGLWAVNKPLSLNACRHGAKFHRLGAKHTEEAKAKISAAKRGKMHTGETRAKISAAAKGKPKAAGHGAKVSAAQAGKPKTAKHSASISAANTGSKWHTDGVTNLRLKPSDVVPEGFSPGKTQRPRLLSHRTSCL